MCEIYLENASLQSLGNVLSSTLFLSYIFQDGEFNENRKEQLVMLSQIHVQVFESLRVFCVKKNLNFQVTSIVTQRQLQNNNGRNHLK